MAGGVLAALGALEWYYAFWWIPHGSYCSGNACYQTIAEPVPGYLLAILPVGLVWLGVGIFLFARASKAAPKA